MRRDVVEFIWSIMSKRAADNSVVFTSLSDPQYKTTVKAPNQFNNVGQTVGALAGHTTAGKLWQGVKRNLPHLPFAQYAKRDPNVFPDYSAASFSELQPAAQRVLNATPTYTKLYPPIVHVPVNYSPKDTAAYTDSLSNLPEQYAKYIHTGDKPGITSIRSQFNSAAGQASINPAKFLKERESLFRQMQPAITPAVHPIDPGALRSSYAIPQETMLNATGTGRKRIPTPLFGDVGGIGVDINTSGGPVNLSDQLVHLIHEAEHTGQGRTVGRTPVEHEGSVEFPAVLRELAFNAENIHRAGGTVQGKIPFTPLRNIAKVRSHLYDNPQILEDFDNAAPTWERLRTESDRHGIYDGRSMTEVLNRPEARQYFKRLYGLAAPHITPGFSQEAPVNVARDTQPIQTDSKLPEHYHIPWWQQLFSR